MVRVARVAEPMPARVPGALMLHPAMVLSVGVLALNDHWLKPRFGVHPGAGVVTGKLSDVAGLAFFPALATSVVEVARWACRRDRDGSACSRRELAAAMAVTAAGFAAIQSVPAAAAGYEALLAVVRWCPAGVAAVLSGGPMPPLPRVGHVMDGSDSLCLPAMWASYWAGSRMEGRARAGAARTRRGGLVAS